VSLLLAAALLLQAKSAEQLVEQLRSEKIEERNGAAMELRKLDTGAIPALEKASRDADPEVSRAAKEILGEIKGRLDAAVAEKAFRKIEEAFDKARSLKARFSMELTEDGGPPITASGEVWVKEGNKLFVLARVDGPSQHKETRIYGAGGKMVTERDGKASAPEAAWPDLSTRMTAGFLRVGIAALDKIAHYTGPSPKEEADIKNILVLSGFRTGPDEGEARTIAFRVEAGKSEELIVTLTYDHQTFRLLKRTTKVMKRNRLEVSVVEKYDEFTLDAEIPDERFAFPEGKK
jgi:outer membrane lipoprotein-sorting protein